MTEPCDRVACGMCGALVRLRPAGPRLAIARCACGHSTASHARAPSCATDYHAQYEQGEFVDALRRTRVRQAARWIALIRRCAPSAQRLLDFGCGRGWFAQAAHEAGFTVAGADASAMAVDGLRSAGIEAMLVAAERPEDFDPQALSFRPQVVTFLDVVEHLPPARARELLATLLAKTRPDLQLVVIKVPSSTGMLYRTARMLAAMGWTGPVEQLYQVGTSPPHVAYYSRRSLDGLVTCAGLQPVAWEADLDFEPDALRERSAVLRRAPRWAVAGAAAGVAAATQALGMEDSIVCAAVPRGR